MTEKPPAGAAPWVDPDDAPELTAEYFERADWYEGDRLIRGGRAPGGEEVVALDPDLLDRLRATGPGWQARLNDAVREWLARNAA